MSKCSECQARSAGRVGNRYGMVYVQVGACYIGQKVRVIIERLEDDDERRDDC